MQDFTALAERIKSHLKNGATIYICGNGGSATQADHFAGELVCSGIRCVSLNNIAAVTALANDYGYGEVFSRQLQSMATAGDVLIVLTTSCESENIKEALEIAKELNMFTVGFTGDKDLAGCDVQYKIPANTQAIQELTIIWLHSLWRLLE